MLNKTISGYTIKRKLGEGGMAEVWYAENSIGKPAAVKILKKMFCEDETVTKRFENEARVMVDLEHPNIRQVRDYTIVDGRPCIIMEYLEGADLTRMVHENGRIDPETAAHYWNKIVSALAYTHKQGVIHRDIKPSNIFVTSKGQVKLLDFGIAKVRDAVSGTQTGQKLGTLVYMSPEQITDSKHVDTRTDLYSLAVTFVHLLSGQSPYDADTSSEYAIMNQIVQNPVDLTGVPEEWQAFLRPYLEKDPSKRPELMAFHTSTSDSEDVTKEETDGSPFPGTKEPVTKTSPRRKLPLWAWIAGGALLIAVFAVTIGTLSSKAKTDQKDEMAATDTLAMVEKQGDTATLKTIPAADGNKTDDGNTPADAQKTALPIEKQKKDDRIQNNRLGSGENNRTAPPTWNEQQDIGDLADHLSKTKIWFDDDNDTPKVEDNNGHINSVVAILKKNSSFVLLVAIPSGDGTEDQQRDLASRRSTNLRNLFIRRGLNPRQIETQSYGSADPQNPYRQSKYLVFRIAKR